MKNQFEPPLATFQCPDIYLVKVQAFVYRAPIETPVQTSFGIMYDRPSVLVRVEDESGAIGWGEIWCNFPSIGAEHRARVLESCVAPILLEKKWSHPNQAFTELSERLKILAIQSGEFGTIAQAIAGVDLAMWDLVGQRLNQPIWKLLGGGQTIQTYASGLSPTDPERLAINKREEGYRAFKLKVGFGQERDLKNLRTLRETLGDEATLMVDANQAWTLDQAIDMSQKLAQFNPIWLEEPMAADAPIDLWVSLGQQSAIELAAGENMRGEAQFSEAIDSGAFAVLQPDVGKWGGLSGCLSIARQALANGRMLCPHWLGGGVGLMASMHFKAIVGGAGYVEVDSNPNPLRDLLLTSDLQPSEGVVCLSNRPGFGISPDLDAIQAFRVPHQY